MFYGTCLKPNTPIKPTKEDGGDLLHLSQICLNNPKVIGKTYIQVVNGENKFNVACLEKDKIEYATIDLFISTDKDIKLQTTGASNEVHVVGFFEPEPSDVDDFENQNQINQLNPSKRSNLLNEASTGKKKIKLKEDKDDFTSKELKKILGLNSEKIKTNGKIDHDDDDDDNDEDDEDEDDDEDDEELLDLEADEDNEEDDDEEDEDDDDDDDDIEEDDDDDDDENNENVEVLDSDDGLENSTKNVNNKKTPQNAQAEKSTPKTQIKSSLKSNNDDTKVIASSDSDTKFATAITKFLKENGRCNIGLLGNKVKKPAEVKEKLGVFLKARKSLFKVEDDFVSLAEN